MWDETFLAFSVVFCRFTGDRFETEMHSFIQGIPESIVFLRGGIPNGRKATEPSEQRKRNSAGTMWVASCALWVMHICTLHQKRVSVDTNKSNEVYLFFIHISTKHSRCVHNGKNHTHTISTTTAAITRYDARAFSRFVRKLKSEWTECACESMCESSHGFIFHSLFYFGYEKSNYSSSVVRSTPALELSADDVYNTQRNAHIR